MPTICHGRIDVAATLTDGALTINGVLLHTPAYAAVDVTELWEPADQRGDNILIPGKPGRVPMPKRDDETERSVPLILDGAVTSTGAVISNPTAGLFGHWMTLRAALGGGDLVPASLSAPGGGPGISADVHVMGIAKGTRLGTLMACTLDLLIPAGAFY